MPMTTSVYVLACTGGYKVFHAYVYARTRCPDKLNFGWASLVIPV